MTPFEQVDKLVPVFGHLSILDNDLNEGISSTANLNQSRAAIS
jgi:hypothetical protein